MLPTIIIFIFILGLLIFVHEFGHFVMAKRAGVRVDEFGFGFPPHLFSVKKGETTYSLNLIPLGGFVKIYGERGEGRGEVNSFISKSISQRALIISAGVLMNFLLAMFLLTLGHVIGLPTVLEGDLSGAKITNPKIQITAIEAGSPAEKAGLQIGDTIKQARSLSEERIVLEIKEVKDFQDFVDKYQGQKIILSVQRGENILDIEIVPRRNPPPGQGPLGIAFAKIAIVSYPIFQAIIKGITDTVGSILLIVISLAHILYNLIVGLPVGDVLAGPVGIYQITSQAAELGYIYILHLTVLLTINLGIINILPFPALDGGRLVFLLIEKIKGSPVSQKTENLIHAIGFTILIILMILVTYKDIIKLFQWR